MSHCRERLGGLGRECSGVGEVRRLSQVRNAGWPVWVECREQGEGRDWRVGSRPWSGQVGSEGCLRGFREAIVPGT